MISVERVCPQLLGVLKPARRWSLVVGNTPLACVRLVDAGSVPPIVCRRLCITLPATVAHFGRQCMDIRGKEVIRSQNETRPCFVIT